MLAALPTVYAAVDWLSCTTGDTSDADVAYSKARALALEQESEGNRVTPWQAHGYRGFGAPHIRCGVRENDVLIELSGDLAAKYWQEFYALARNVSRIDTQVTVTHDPPRTGLAEQAYNAPGKPLLRGHKPVEKRLVKGTNGGETCYVGSVRSDRMGRLYDKSAESRGEWPAGSWRYEIQERGALGRFTAGALNSVDDVPRSIKAYVSSFYSHRGIQPWFQSDGPSLSNQLGRTRSDLRKHLNWLSLQVAPGIRRWRNHGHTAAILAALELDNLGGPS